MQGLPRLAWERFGWWLADRSGMYFVYGYRHSENPPELRPQRRFPPSCLPRRWRASSHSARRPSRLQPSMVYGPHRRPLTERPCLTTGSPSAARASTTSAISTSTCPRDRLVVITGLSGSGKSSLAFDTIYAEGQRRYVESLSAYARQFLEQMEKPDVDLIDGLSPAISIEQKTTGSQPAIDGRHRHRDLRLPAAALRQHRRPALPELRTARSPPVARAHHRHGDDLSAGRAHQRARADRPRPQGRVQEGAGRPARPAASRKARIDGQFKSLEDDIAARSPHATTPSTSSSTG